MPITAKDEDALTALVESHHTSVGTKRREDFFPLLYIPRKFGIDPVDVVPHTAFGNNDYGIDAYHIDRGSRNLYLYQFKWSENPQLFKESLERLTTDGMARIFGNPITDPSRNEVLRSLKSDLEEVRSLIDRVYIHFVFKGDADKAESSAGLQDRKEQLENKAHIVEQFFGRAVPVLVEFVADRRSGATVKLADSHTFPLGSHLTCAVPDGPSMLVGAVRLLDLHHIHRQLGQRFFDRNIRAGLSPDNPPNRKIRQALESILMKGQLQPEWFVFHHNGITLAAEKAKVVDGQVTVKVPRLLNGAQTVTSFGKFMEDNRDHPAIKNSQGALERILVLAKIVVDDPFGETVTRITISNNQQNPVHPWNLRANDRIQVDLEDKFREELRLPYERLENAFRELTEEQMDEYDHDEPIKIRPLAQTLCAMQGDVATMPRVRDIFEEQKIYDVVFHRRYASPTCDARRILLSYKIGTCTSIVLRHMEDRAPVWLKAAVRRSRCIVWALLVQALFNDNRLDAYLEAWGGSLKREQDFRELFRSLSANKILTILKEVYAEPAIKEKIERGLFEFVKSKEVFRKCMQVAQDRFNWQKQSV